MTSGPGPLKRMMSGNATFVPNFLHSNNTHRRMRMFHQRPLDGDEQCTDATNAYGSRKPLTTEISKAECTGSREQQKQRELCQERINPECTQKGRLARADERYRSA